MTKVGILYICTGKYEVFWEDFYKSFEEKFLNGCELHYFVFTDAEHIYGEEDNMRIHKKHIEALPWPLITLFRFKTFLSIEEDLTKLDYLMFFNSNMICNDNISVEEFLPRKEMGEELFVTVHPGYAHSLSCYMPFERSKKSYAYVPYNKSKKYVCGGVNGGTPEAFLRMSKILNRAIDEDLKKNVIARWHDESHLNRYIVDRTDVRILGPGYCYPCGKGYEYPKKILVTNKDEKFDVNDFKGVYRISEKELFIKRVCLLLRMAGDIVGTVRDTLLCRKPREYDFL
jgi:hypothetical protein